MKPLSVLKTALLIFFYLPAALSVKAQATLEFGNGSGPSGSGASIANQVVTFLKNANNPSGNTFTNYTSPTTTVTFSLSNQQYTLTAAQISTKAAVSFGAAVNGSSQTAATSGLYEVMSSVGGAVNTDFTSGPGITAGTGIATNANYSIEVFNSAMGLFNANSSTTGRYYTAELTIAFSSPLTNPVIHLAGLGGTEPEGTRTLGLTSEFDLETTGVTLSKLSGSTELDVTSNQILNSATHPTATTGSGAASGTILVTGTAISQLVFKVYMRGDGRAPAWTASGQHTGDQFLIGVSTLITNITLPVSLMDFTATAQANHTTRLQWATATEENSNFFDVEYSTDQVAWESIGSVKAAGNSSTQRNYSFIHSDPASGDNYYRLKEVDMDGAAVYSKICQVSFNDPSRLSFYPNPVKDRVTITNGVTTPQSVTVMTIDGRQLQQNNQFLSGGSIDMSRYPSGMYFLAIRNTSGNTEVLKILKN